MCALRSGRLSFLEVASRIILGYLEKLSMFFQKHKIIPRRIDKTKATHSVGLRFEKGLGGEDWWSNKLGCRHEISLCWDSDTVGKWDKERKSIRPGRGGGAYYTMVRKLEIPLARSMHLILMLMY